ncbi:MAG: hypothetical protein IKE17_03205 [Clostridia bacterium]|nr:hypothetical protein [Clostridia bacterium]
MPRNKPHVLTSIPEYEGAAVYALIDDTGRPYIGSTNDFQRRMRTWEVFMRQVLKEKCLNGLLSQQIGVALLSGRSFRAAVVEALPRDMGYADRIAHERAALLSVGGLDCTYNRVIPRTWGNQPDAEGLPTPRIDDKGLVMV